MSRSFLPDQILIDRLMVDDTEAFEELYRRYWHSLYNYSYQKLRSSESARRIVRDLFVRLWEMRKTIPVDFVISEHLYAELRKSVVIHLSSQLNMADVNEQEDLVKEFSLESLMKARLPVPAPARKTIRQTVIPREHPRLFVTLSHVKWLFQTVTAKLL